ncbi:MAG TPA: metallophosphoesterase [Pirellulales bacterium]|jgi:hypothetical protein|nr:metallophosphoesterase [Pirellulales bacterium]
MQAKSATALRLGVVSDTHGHMGNTLAAVRMLESLEVDVVLHCGDIGSPAIVPLFTKWPTHFVFGNVDFPEAPLTAAIQCEGLTGHGRFAELELAGQRIAMLHGDDNAKLVAAIAGQQFDLVCHGHTHQVRQERRGRTLVLNPGALYRASAHTLAIVELPAMTATIVTVG